MLWRLFPRGLRLRHSAFADYVRLGRRSTGVRQGRRLHAARVRHAHVAPARRGQCTVVGLFRSRSGLGRAAWLNAVALSQAGYEVELLDYNPATRTTSLHAQMAARNGPAPGPDLLLIHLNPPQSSHALDAVLKLEPGPRPVPRLWAAFWVWETESAPAAWLRDAGLYDEIWIPSRFAEAAFRDSRAPLRLMPHPCAIEPPTGRGDGRAARERLGLGQDAFVLAFAFDMRSGFARKNPLGLIEAFRRAFADDPAARLVLRAGSQDIYRKGLAMLHAAVADDPAIRLVGSETDIAELYLACDAYASLHRSEGFGMTLAEAMLHARPVVATGWSGNLDYMDMETAALVPFRLVPIVDPQRTYAPGHVWAEPDLDAAAAAFRRLAADPIARTALGLRGCESVRRRLSALPPLEASRRESARASA